MSKMRVMSGELDPELKDYLMATVNRILDNFDDIGGSNMGLQYDSDTDYASMVESLASRSGRRVGLLKIGPDFFSESKDCQKAVIAHEIGHLEHFCNLTEEEFDKIGMMRPHRTLWLDIPKETPIESIPDAAIGYADWYVNNEIYADNKSADLGYGAPLLEFLKKDFDNTAWVYDYATNKRIENLEQRLGEDLIASEKEKIDDGALESNFEDIIKEREAIEKAHKLYSQGHKEFPEVKMAGYNVRLCDCEVGVTVSYGDVRDGLCPLDVNYEFLEYPLPVQRAIVAHEYGHLERLQGKDCDYIEKSNLITNCFEFVLTYCLECSKENPDEEIEISDEMQEVLDFNLEDEMHADSAAAKRGHGRPILDFIKANYDMHKDDPLFIKNPLKVHFEERIENLEGKLNEF